MSHGLTVQDVGGVVISNGRVTRLRVVNGRGDTVAELSAVSNRDWQMSVGNADEVYVACWALAEFWSNNKHVSAAWAAITAQRHTVADNNGALVVTNTAGAALAVFGDDDTPELSVRPDTATAELFATAAALWADYEARGSTEPDAELEPDAGANNSLPGIVIRDMPATKAVHAVQAAPGPAVAGNRHRWVALMFLIAGAAILAVALPDVISAYNGN